MFNTDDLGKAPIYITNFSFVLLEIRFKLYV